MSTINESINNYIWLIQFVFVFLVVELLFTLFIIISSINRCKISSFPEKHHVYYFHILCHEINGVRISNTSSLFSCRTVRYELKNIKPVFLFLLHRPFLGDQSLRSTFSLNHLVSFSLISVSLTGSSPIERDVHDRYLFSYRTIS